MGYWMQLPGHGRPLQLLSDADLMMFGEMLPTDMVINLYLIEPLSREPLQAIIGDDFIPYQQQESQNHCYNSEANIDSEDDVVEVNDIAGQSEVGVGNEADGPMMDDDGPVLDEDGPSLNANGPGLNVDGSGEVADGPTEVDGEDDDAVRG